MAQRIAKTLTAQYVYPSGDRATVSDAIVDYTRRGVPVDVAASMCGVWERTLRDWLRLGARTFTAIESGASARGEFTQHQRRCAAFFFALERAVAESEARDLIGLDRLAEGGIPQVTVKEKRELNRESGEDRVVETTTRTTHTLPDRSALQWRLERRFPQKYGRRAQLDIGLSVGAADPTALLEQGDPIDGFLREMEALQKRKKESLEELKSAGIIEADSEAAD